MITLKVSFTDPTGRYDTVAQSIISNFNAAFDVYRPFLPPRAIQLEVDLKMVVDPDVYANGGSAAVAYVGDLDGLDLFLAGAAYELATGNDLNAGSADLTVNIGTKGFDTAMWIDPLDGRDAPDGRYSLVKIFIHEIGHALGFNGWRDYDTYRLPGDYLSTFDQWITVVDGAPYFSGPHSTKVYGSPVPLMAGNVMHVGNPTGLPGSELQSDVMYGYVSRLTPYTLSALDIAVLSDTGLPTSLGSGLIARRAR